MKLTIEVPDAVGQGIAAYPDQQAIYQQIQTLIAVYYQTLTERQGETRETLLREIQSSLQSKGMTDKLAAELLDY